MSPDDLHATAVNLVAELPHDANDVSGPQRDALAGLFDAIADRLDESAARIDTMLDVARQRGHEPGGQPLSYLTAAERSVFDVGDLRALDASLAHETLARWTETSGWH